MNDKTTARLALMSEPFMFWSASDILIQTNAVFASIIRLAKLIASANRHDKFQAREFA